MLSGFLRRRGVLLLLIAAFAVVGLALAMRIGPPVAYYLDRARYHARLEKAYASELKKDRDDRDFMEWEHSALVSAHARQKAKYLEAAWHFWRHAPSDL